MAQETSSDPVLASERLTTGEAVAIAIAVAWFVVIGIFFAMLDTSQMSSVVDDRLRWTLMVIATFAPVGMILLAVWVARFTRIIRAELYSIQNAIDGVRQIQSAQQASPEYPAPTAQQSTVETREIAIEEKPAGAPISGFSSRREVSRLIVPLSGPQAAADQPSLALETGVEEVPPTLERADYIKALNFPDDERDTAGFDALRRALRDRTARRLVQASQDVLTLLSQDGIYMDDLNSAPADASLWRSFAAGERGKSMDRLGAVRDQAALNLIANRSREDTIFRDAVHHFLRRFDEMLVSFEDQATDTDLLALAKTRTARAFMLLARASGTFD
ncbi:hypothetical protein [Yoonia sp.]|uniref:hypothetical protein n=1 Tax=Yoonia sp. TaxID=2212373 RepID=UPI0023B5F549